MNGVEGLTDVATKDVFDLYLLETTLDYETLCAVHGSRCTHLGKQELDNMLRLLLSRARAQ